MILPVQCIGAKQPHYFFVQKVHFQNILVNVHLHMPFMTLGDALPLQFVAKGSLKRTFLVSSKKISCFVICKLRILSDKKHLSGGASETPYTISTLMLLYRCMDSLGSNCVIHGFNYIISVKNDVIECINVGLQYRKAGIESKNSVVKNKYDLSEWLDSILSFGTDNG